MAGQGCTDQQSPATFLVLKKHMPSRTRHERSDKRLMMDTGVLDDLHGRTWW